MKGSAYNEKVLGMYEMLYPFKFYYTKIRKTSTKMAIKVSLLIVTFINIYLYVNLYGCLLYTSRCV